MTKQDVLNALTDFTPDFPKEALKEVQANRADFIPELLESLDYVYRNADKSSEDLSDYFLHTYAMYLLAEFREKEAFPYLTALLRLPEKPLDFLLGDGLTEDFHKMLLCTFDSAKLQMLLDIIEDREAFEWARSSAIHAYELIYKEGFVTREECVSYLRSLIYDKLPPDDSEIVFTAIAGCIIDCRLVEMIPDARFLYDNDRIYTRMHGDYDEFLDWIFYEKPYPENSRYIDDAVAEMESWHCFNREDEKGPEQKPEKPADSMADKTAKDNILDQFEKKQVKTGRNDPCPCGSGKKFKKCCIGESAVNRLEDKYDLLERYPKDSPLFKELYYEEEAIDIDMLVYKALHRRVIPLWVKRDHEQERLDKIDYLKEALDLFLDKCRREQITSFAAYDERYMIHYRSSEWMKALIILINDDDAFELIDIRKTAKDILRKFA
ncbi:MAG: DUF1186 domain-containing protein [Defluviitaleaceae bacterium]|nr:DUF1186 domain-containing protein [Defluviitaleaceae bacterium]